MINETRFFSIGGKQAYDEVIHFIDQRCNKRIQNPSNSYAYYYLGFKPIAMTNSEFGTVELLNVEGEMINSIERILRVEGVR